MFFLTPSYAALFSYVINCSHLICTQGLTCLHNTHAHTKYNHTSTLTQDTQTNANEHMHAHLLTLVSHTGLILTSIMIMIDPDG